MVRTDSVQTKACCLRCMALGAGFFMLLELCRNMYECPVLLIYVGAELVHGVAGLGPATLSAKDKAFIISCPG
jgi:hypothetical protein